MQRLWNRPSLPVYSLSTLSAEGVPNMNICTYVGAISLSPKLMQVAVYHGTATHQNIRVGETVLLQLLSEPLAPAVRICGRLSGKSTDKITRLQKRFEIETHSSLPYFSLAAGFITLKVNHFIVCGGDHDLLIGEVITHRNLQDLPLLTTDYLRTHGYIRG